MRPPESYIVFVSTTGAAPWGGSEELWSQTALRLANAGLAVAASVCKWPEIPRRVESLLQIGVKVQRRPTKHRLSTRAWRRAFWPGTTPLVLDLVGFLG